MTQGGDPKKTAPGALDAYHREESPQAASLLVEMVGAEGRRPDELAWALQKRDLAQELFLLAPFLVGAALEVAGMRLPDLVMGAYVFLLGPVLALRLLWRPLRGRFEDGPTALLRDVAFLGASLVQSAVVTLGVAVLVHFAAGFFLQELGLPRGLAVEAASLATWVLLAPYLFVRALAANLVEREFEGRVLASLSAEEMAESGRPLGALELWGSRLRTLFRASLPALLGTLPVALLLGLGSFPGGRMLATLGMVLGWGLGGAQLFRGFFYAALGDQARRLLEARAPEPGATGAAPGRELRVTPGDRAWALARVPGELLTTVGSALVGVGLFFGIAALGKALGVSRTAYQAFALGGSLLAASPFLARRFLRERERERERDSERSLDEVREKAPEEALDEARGEEALPASPALLAASLPACLAAAGTVFLMRTAVSFLGFMGLVTVVQSLGLLILGLEGTSRLWARGVRRCLAPGNRPASPRSLLARTREGGTAWRRASILVAGAWGIGLVLLEWARAMGHTQGDLAFVLLLLLPGWIGGQFLLRSHLHEELEEEAPGPLPLPGAARVSDLTDPGEPPGGLPV